MEDPDIRRLVIYIIGIVVITVLMCGAIYAVLAESKTTSITGCFYEAPRIPYYYIEPVVVDIDNINVVKTLECMIQLESRGNPQAFNPMDTDNREKFGLLQFGDIEWKEWCVDSYGYPNEIFNGNLQYMCADRMIRDGQYWRWPSFYKCSYTHFRRT